MRQVTVNLDKLSSKVRQLIAKETNDDELLAILAEDEFDIVRIAVAENKKTSVETLAIMLDDKSPDVLYSVIERIKSLLKAM